MEKISKQWGEFYDKLQKADKSNMISFATSLDIIDKYNEPIFYYLNLNKIPVIYITDKKLKDSALFKKFSHLIPTAIFWCVHVNYKGIDRTSIFVNTKGTNLYNIARISMHSVTDLFEMLESILVHESIHAYLYSINFDKNKNWVGMAMSMIYLIIEKINLTSNEYIKNRLNVINNSDPQEVITYILTESILSNFVRSINIDKKNGWIAYLEFINSIDPHGILIKYAAKRQEIPDMIIAEAELKYKLFLHKNPVEKMKEGGVINFNEEEGKYYAEKISVIVEKFGRKYYYPSVSITNFGTSIYVENPGYGKIRFSDHGVMNKERIFEEIHYRLKDLDNPKIIPVIEDDIEKVLFPERFKKFDLNLDEKHIVRSPLVKISDLKNPDENPYKIEHNVIPKKIIFEYPEYAILESDKITNERISKKGTKLFTVERIYQNHQIKLIDKKTNKVIREISLKEQDYDNSNIITMLQDGGLIEGKSHEQGGVKATIENTGKKIELEGGEAIIKKEVVDSSEKYEFEGQEKTPREILNKLNTDEGGNKI